MRLKVKRFDDNWKRFLHILEDWKNVNLAPFCLNNCDAKCCKEMEHSGLNEEQVKLLFNLSKDDSIDKFKNKYGESMIKQDNYGFYTAMCYGVFCPALSGNKCIIYSNPLKPKYCDDFPFYYSEIDGNPVFEMEKCPGTLSLDLSILKKAAEKSGISVMYLEKNK